MSELITLVECIKEMEARMVALKASQHTVIFDVGINYHKKVYVQITIRDRPFDDEEDDEC